MKVCIDVDAGWRVGGLMTIGAKRSPLHDPAQVAGSRARDRRPRAELELDGLMAYEGQIAGVGDRPPGQAADAARAADRAGAVGARVGAPARGDRRRRALGRAAAVRQRRRDRLDRAHRRRARRDRGGRGLRPVRARRCSTPTAPSSRARRRCSRCRWCASRRRSSPPRWAAATRPRAPRARPAAAPVPPAGLRLDAREGAGEVQTPLAGGGAGWRSATASGSATPRRASCASASTSCT